MESLLGVKFPKSYKNFLLEKGSAVIDGFKILGLPTREVGISFWEGAFLLS